MTIRFSLVMIALGLWAPPGHAQPKPKMLGGIVVTAVPGSVHTCFPHVHRCLIPVYVHPDGQRKCVVFSNPEKIVVPQPETNFGHNRIKIIWVLKKGEPSTKIQQYQFAVNTGVFFDDTTSAQPRDQFSVDGNGRDTADPEDGDSDDDTGTEMSKRRFRWLSTHKVTGDPVHYNFNVLRTTTIAGVKQTFKCESVDPTITNTN
jgi:hypothetical protein